MKDGDREPQTGDGRKKVLFYKGFSDMILNCEQFLIPKDFHKDCLTKGVVSGKLVSVISTLSG